MNVLDGPAKGQHLMIRRCPLFLRMVQNARGQWDALDQVEDDPKVGETVYVYERIPGTHFNAFVRPGGRHEFADYKFIPEAPTDVLRKREDWQAWCVRQFELMSDEWKEAHRVDFQRQEKA